MLPSPALYALSDQDILLMCGWWDIFALFKYTYEYKEISQGGRYVSTLPRTSRQVYNRLWPLEQ